MKFAQFLKEAIDSKENNQEESGDEKKNDDLKVAVESAVAIINKNAKTMKIFPVKEVYLLDQKDINDELKAEDLAGYFIYKNNIGSQDDFYIGKFIYHIKNDKIDILLKDISDTFKTISDTELHIKNKLKGNKMDL